MAEYRPKGRGLERVLGTGSLFSTAYGNVGSSIYYALGLVAIYALGMTPVVFVIAGLIFACTAATYTEATTMFPEAGGSSSFARRAFNEFWSFFAAWGQMLTYIITIAISAFFVPHYLGVFWEPLGESPADIVGGILVVALLGSGERRRGQGVGGRERLLRGRRLLHAGAAGGGGNRAGAEPRGAGQPDRLRHDAHGQRLPDRDPRRNGGLHRNRDDLEHGRGSPRRRPHDPARDGARGGGGVRDLRLPAGGGALRDAGRGRRDRAGEVQGGGGLRRRSHPRRGGEHRTSARCRARPRSTSGSSPRPSCSSPPTPG